ncbi:MAG: hypothetical protein ACRDKI_11565 [Solirubrobacterales bacterium]
MNTHTARHRFGSYGLLLVIAVALQLVRAGGGASKASAALIATFVGTRLFIHAAEWENRSFVRFALSFIGRA